MLDIYRHRAYNNKLILIIVTVLKTEHTKFNTKQLLTR